MAEWSEIDYEESFLLQDASAQYGKSVNDRAAYIDSMRRRTKTAAVRVINFVEDFSPSPALRVISYQLIKSATSTAANYRAACVARSGREFFAKMSIVVEEADETVFWLETLYESKVKVSKEAIVTLGKEWREISKIMSVARKTAKLKK